MKKYLFAIVIFLLLAPRVDALTWHVNKSGSDGNSCVNAQSSSPSSAMQTIRAAIQCARDNGAAGNAVEIAAGIYDERFESGFIPSGTAGNFFTITNKPGETVIIQPSTLGGLFDPVFSFEGSSQGYIWLKGSPGLFQIDGTNQQANSISINGLAGC